MNLTLSKLEDVGMIVDPDKLDFMHFTQRARATLPSIAYTIDDREGTVTPKKVMRWIGIYFDSCLTF